MKKKIHIYSPPFGRSLLRRASPHSDPFESPTAISSPHLRPCQTCCPLNPTRAKAPKTRRDSDFKSCKVRVRSAPAKVSRHERHNIVWNSFFRRLEPPFCVVIEVSNRRLSWRALVLSADYTAELCSTLRAIHRKESLWRYKDKTVQWGAAWCECQAKVITKMFKRWTYHFWHNILNCTIRKSYQASASSGSFKHKGKRIQRKERDGAKGYYCCTQKANRYGNMEKAHVRRNQTKLKCLLGEYRDRNCTHKTVKWYILYVLYIRCFLPPIYCGGGYWIFQVDAHPPPTDLQKWCGRPLPHPFLTRNGRGRKCLF